MATSFIFIRAMSLNEITNRIQQAGIEFSRKPDEVKLIAVSKVQPNERIEAVLEQGHRVFGENRVQEAQSKWPAFKEKYEDVELHIIGPLQTNKTRVAMEIADSIHTLDPAKASKKYSAYCARAWKVP